MSHKVEYKRTPSCFGDAQESALEAVKRGDYQLLSDLLNQASDDIGLNRTYPRERQKTLLSIAIENGDTKSVEVILSAASSKASEVVNFVNPLLKSTAIHVAVRVGNPKILEILLLHGADPNAATADGKTILHLLLKKIAAHGKYDEASMECLRIALSSDRVFVDAKDHTDNTPLSFLISLIEDQRPLKTEIRECLKLLLEKGADPKTHSSIQPFISSLADSTLTSLLNSNLGGRKTLNSVPVQSGLTADLFTYLNEADLRRTDLAPYLRFQAALEYVTMSELSRNPAPGTQSVLQRACELGLDKFVELLLSSKKADPNQYGVGTSPAVILAAKQGRSSILKLLAEYGVNFDVVDYNGDTVLTSILRKPLIGSLSRKIDYLSTWNEFCTLRSEISYLEPQLRKVINEVDELRNTALHYATQFWSQTVVCSLLELGANIGMKNIYNETPVDRILPDTMKQFLDSYCLEYEGNVSNEDFKITVKYDFLAPPILPEVKSATDEKDPMPLPETEVLWHMSQSEGHRRLLKHPVITSFLWLKWRRLSSSYNKNLAFYAFYVVFLTWFIFATFSGRALRSNGLVKETCEKTPTPPLDVTILWYVNAVFLSVMTLREMLQFGIAPRRYIFSIENWLEIAVIVLSLILLVGTFGCNVSVKRHAGAIAIVISWSVLITMVGRHPKLSTYNIYVTMFYKVLWTFVVFLLWYSMFIFAFALGFYVLLHRDDGDFTKEEEDYPFFDFLSLCIFKTFVMFVGELEFSDLPVSTPFGNLYVMAFVFLIVVVMMNLLNGLAVSDTGVIREEAEIHSIICQVEVISYIEAMLLGDPFNFLSNWPSFIWLRNVPDFNLGSRLYSVPALRSLFHKLTGGAGILLFYERLQDKKVSLYPNRDEYRCCSLGCKEGETNTFHPSILASAKDVIVDKIKQENNIESRMESLEKVIRRISERQNDFSAKMDKLLSKIYQ